MLTVSRTDLFARYSQIFQKERAREIVPEGPFVRQFVDLPHQDLDIGVFFKSKGNKTPVQVHIGESIPLDVGKQEGFLETDYSTYLSHTILKKFKELDYLRVAIGAGTRLKHSRDRIDFLKKCQRIIDVLLRKAKNITHLGSFSAFRFDNRIYSLENYLSTVVGLDDVGVEAASIPFNMANPRYILLTGNEVIVVGKEVKIEHNVFHFVGGIGYVFDKKEGALSEERLFKSTTDLSGAGITEAYVEDSIAKVTDDFQSNLHSIIFSDIWKKSEAKPIGINIDGNMLLRPAQGSEIWTGVFEVYLTSP